MSPCDAALVDAWAFFRRRGRVALIGIKREALVAQDAFAFAIAFFIAVSTASGVCSQSGIVNTAFAFAAAARKSSTVFNSAAETVKLETSRRREM